jgi:hypothetical protein
MGLLDGRRQRAESKRAQQATTDADARHRAWQEEGEWLAARLQDAQHLEGYDQSALGTVPSGRSVQLKRGEVAYLAAGGAGLVETRRGPGHYLGSYGGASFRVAKGITVRSGSSRGTYVPGEEQFVPIDTNGMAVITNQRVMFSGARQAREWSFAKLLGFEVVEPPGVVFIQVSNRQKVSAVGFGDGTRLAVARLELALADFNDTRPALIERMAREVAAHDQAKPAPFVLKGQ